jgi:hypothetical protein
MNILWDPGESFDLALKITAKLQPRTLIMYFPALTDRYSSTHQPTISLF